MERDSNLDLTEDVVAGIESSLERLFDIRAALRDELLMDVVEARTFGVTEHNVAYILEERLQLTELAYREMKLATRAGSINEQPLSKLGIERCDLFKGYVPLALNVYERMEQQRRAATEAFVLGINAPPGTGKSTLIQILLFLMTMISRLRAKDELHICQLGSDDMHMSKEVRKQRALTSRADPRALDPEFHGLLRQLRTAGRGSAPAEVTLPRFNKGLDDREPQGACVEGPFDIVLYEGYRVGVPPGDVDIPGFGNVQFDYSELNKEIDCLVYVDAGVEGALKGKLASCKLDHARERPDEPWGEANEARVMATWDTWIAPYVVKHELPLRETCDILVREDLHHHLLQIRMHERPPEEA